MSNKHSAGLRCPFCPQDRIFKTEHALRAHQRSVGHTLDMPDYEGAEERRRLRMFEEYDRQKRGAE